MRNGALPWAATADDTLLRFDWLCGKIVTLRRYTRNLRSVTGSPESTDEKSTGFESRLY